MFKIETLDPLCFPSFTKLITFNPITGKTHGIRFKMKPPSNARENLLNSSGKLSVAAKGVLPIPSIDVLSIQVNREGSSTTFENGTL